MHFTKMHGLGNDYLYVYGEVPDNICELSQKLSDRHFGAGSDGMIYISPSAIADFKMRIFNADGSEAMMCGNGIRCVGKYVYDKGYTDKTKLLIETLSGIKTLTLQTMGGKVKFVTVRCTPVSVGNPHAVIFVEDAEAVPLADIGPLIEHHEAFPGGTNVEFAQVLSENRIRMRVWERGSGITMACGTGACATAAAAASKGLCVVSSPISVELDGGTLEITVAPDHTIGMTGPAATVYEGEVTE